MLPGELRGRMLQFGTISADGRPPLYAPEQPAMIFDLGPNPI
jgi:hypothetical protein